MIICSKIIDWIFNKFNLAGLTFFPFIFLRSDYKNSKETINHERIHIEQQKELLLIGFLIHYWLSWIYKVLFKRFSADKAYYKIIFEREAFAETNNLKYLQYRKRFNFIKY